MEAPPDRDILLATNSPRSLLKNDSPRSPRSPLNTVKNFMSKFSKNWVPMNAETLEKAELHMLQGLRNLQVFFINIFF